MKKLLMGIFFTQDQLDELLASFLTTGPSMFCDNLLQVLKYYEELNEFSKPIDFDSKTRKEAYSKITKLMASCVQLQHLHREFLDKCVEMASKCEDDEEMRDVLTEHRGEANINMVRIGGDE